MNFKVGDKVQLKRSCSPSMLVKEVYQDKVCCIYASEYGIFQSWFDSVLLEKV